MREYKCDVQLWATLYVVAPDIETAKAKLDDLATAAAITLPDGANRGAYPILYEDGISMAPAMTVTTLSDTIEVGDEIDVSEDADA